MIRNVSLRRGIAALALVAALLPAPSLAQTSDVADAPGQQPASVVGAMMGIACGASINVARHVPAPIVVTVTAVVCAMMILDALTTPDPH
jgi:hypothetical protein